MSFGTEVQYFFTHLHQLLLNFLLFGFQFFLLLEFGHNIHPLMQDSYDLNVTIFNQPIEYQMLMTASAIETGMNFNILLVKMARAFCDCGKCLHKC